jgi:hypothetical protein
MTALSAGGRRLRPAAVEAAPRNADHADLLPLHQGWLAIQAMTSTPSASSCGRYSSSISPSDSPLPRCRRARRHSPGPRHGVHGSSRSAVRRACDRGCIRARREPGLSSGVLRQPHARRQPAAVGKGNPEMFDLGDVAENRAWTFIAALARCSGALSIAVNSISGDRTRLGNFAARHPFERSGAVVASFRVSKPVEVGQCRRSLQREPAAAVQLL